MAQRVKVVHRLKVSVLVDNPGSWFHKYLGDVRRKIEKHGHKYSFFKDPRGLKRGDLLFILSCDKVMGGDEMALHKNNIVIHASDLPEGRGWSPVTWQVEKGKNMIPITLFEADAECDAGDYYIKDHINLNGDEMIDEIREKQAEKTIEMIERFLKEYPMKCSRQKGRPTYFRKRSPKNNELDVNKSIKGQFNKMRVADNERYPLHFKINGRKYTLKIYKNKE